MKILHVIRWRNQNFNGVMNVVPLYVKYQNNLENVFLFNDGNEIKNSDSFNINKNCKKSFSQTINKLKPDIVIFHEVYVFNHIICAKICKKNNIPYIVVPHGSLTRQAQNIKKIKKIGGNLVFFKPFIRNAASIHFLSYGEQNNSLYANNFFISPNGVTIEKDFNKKISNEEKTNTIVYVGRISIRHKGLDLLVDALTEIRDELFKKNYKIYLYGPGEKKELAMMKKSIEDNNLSTVLELKQPVYNNDKKNIIRSAKFYIQTSRFEGLSLSLLEALSLGTPILVTSGCYMDKVVEKYGCGINCLNSSESIKKMISLAIQMNDKEIDKMKKNAIKCIENEYNWEKITQNIVGIYQRVIDNSKI